MEFCKFSIPMFVYMMCSSYLHGDDYVGFDICILKSFVGLVFDMCVLKVIC